MVRTQGQHIVDQRAKKTEVVLWVEGYRRLLEDLPDLAVVAERRDGPTLTLEELKCRLTSRGAAGREGGAAGE